MGNGDQARRRSPVNTPGKLEELQELVEEKKRVEAEKASQVDRELEGLGMWDAFRAKLGAIPKRTPEELEAAEKRRQEREAEEVRRDIIGKLGALRKDVGARLDPFRKATIDSFEVYDPAQEKTVSKVRDFIGGLEDHLEAGDGVFLIGPPGTGKDHLAVAIAREAVIRFRASARWLDVASLRGELRDAIKSAKEEKRTLGPYLRADVLILSDPVPPGSGLSDYQADALFRLVDGRWRELRPTIITANFRDEAEANDRLGSQVVDRLSHGGLRLRCQWESFRRR